MDEDELYSDWPSVLDEAPEGTDAELAEELGAGGYVAPMPDWGVRLGPPTENERRAAVALLGFGVVTLWKALTITGGAVTLGPIFLAGLAGAAVALIAWELLRPLLEPFAGITLQLIDAARRVLETLGLSAELAATLAPLLLAALLAWALTR